MRGIVSEKLKPFLTQVNEQIALAKANGISFKPEIVRENLDKLTALNTKIPAISFTEDRLLSQNTHSIPVRVYSPDKQQPLPVLIYFHGGGHMCGSVELYDPMCRKIANTSQCVVISVDYRLAPEHPYPEGLNDCIAILKHYQELLTGISYSDALYIAGDSAGGAICTSIVMQNTQNHIAKIDGQLLIYPSVDYTMSSDSVKTNGTGFLLESDKVAWYFDNYFQHNEDKQALSPLNAPMSKDMPRSLVITAGCDPLRDEGLAYAGALTAAGVSVTHYSFDHMVHAFINIEDLVPEECAKLYQLMAEFIKADS